MPAINAQENKERQEQGSSRVMQRDSTMTIVMKMQSQCDVLKNAVRNDNAS